MFERASASGLAVTITALAGMIGGLAASWPVIGAEMVPNFAPDSGTGWTAQDDEFILPPAGRDR